MTKAKKILFVTQEMVPFVPETDMAQMGRYLPQAVQEKSREIRSFMPKWGTINERRNQLHEVIRLSGINIVVDDTDHPLVIKVASITAARMQIYFIDNDDFFEKRKMATDDNGKEYEDNAERAAFYARGVLETIKKLKWSPDIIHCQGLGEKKLVPMLNKLGIKYADGIGFLAKNDELTAYAEGLGKPCLQPVCIEDYGIHYPTFYDTIWNIGRAPEEDDESN